MTLLQSEMPFHNHNWTAANSDSTDQSPADNLVAGGLGGITMYNSPGTAQMAPQTVNPVGGGQPHNNMMPYLTLNFCIALQGVFPPRG